MKNQPVQIYLQKAGFVFYGLISAKSVTPKTSSRFFQKETARKSYG